MVHGRFDVGETISLSIHTGRASDGAIVVVHGVALSLLGSDELLMTRADVPAIFVAVVEDIVRALDLATGLGAGSKREDGEEANHVENRGGLLLWFEEKGSVLCKRNKVAE